MTIETFRLLIMDALDLARIARRFDHEAEPVCMSPIQSEFFLIAEKSVQGKIKISMMGIMCESRPFYLTFVEVNLYESNIRI